MNVGGILASAFAGAGMNYTGMKLEQIMQKEEEARKLGLEQIRAELKSGGQHVGYDESGAPLLQRDVKEGQSVYNEGLSRDKPGWNSNKGKEFADLAAIFGEDRAREMIAGKEDVSATEEEYNALEKIFGADKAKEMVGSKYEPKKEKPTGKAAEYQTLVDIYGEEKAKEMFGSGYEPKTEYKPGQALEKIAKIDQTIGELRANEGISDPEVASAFGVGVGMKPEDTEQAIESLMNTRKYFEQFAPQDEAPSGKGILENEIGASVNMDQFISSLLGKQPTKKDDSQGESSEQTNEIDYEGGRERAAEASAQYQREKEEKKKTDKLKEELAELAKKKRKSGLTSQEEKRMEQLKSILVK